MTPSPTPIEPPVISSIRIFGQGASTTYISDNGTYPLSENTEYEAYIEGSNLTGCRAVLSQDANSFSSPIIDMEFNEPGLCLEFDYELLTGSNGFWIIGPDNQSYFKAIFII